ncbi:MAG: alpha/beta hydrolase [Alphaproteobacteria bacterium]|jgi:arylformamidase|nr:alpha/beta hydrolase [Alphaproteobacteria bacterium]
MGEAKVWRNYDQAGLDAQYNNRIRFPDYKARFAAWAEWSAATRENLDGRLDVAVGAHPGERIDIFPAQAPRAAIHVFIHGGYWYSLDKSDYSYVAEGMAPNGVTTVLTNHVLAPHGSMDEIVAHTRAALAWTWRNAADFGADASRIFVSGHSAGGQLAMMMLATDWPAYGSDLPQDLVKGVAAISGLFELEPIQRSYLNETLRMDPAMATRNSPALLTYPRPAPLLLVPGADESDEYRRQSGDMAERWRALGYPCEMYVPAGLDHFSVVDSLIDPNAELVSRLLETMGQAWNGKSHADH